MSDSALQEPISKCPICGEDAKYRDGYYFCYVNVNHVVDEIYYRAGIERERKNLKGKFDEYE